MTQKLEKDKVIEWLLNNEPTIIDIINQLKPGLREALGSHLLFSDEIYDEYTNEFKLILSEEISRQLGISTDIIYEVLEEANIHDSLRSNNIQ